ncbi:MAG: HD domain-containing protein [Lachnospiraceae bacterium]|nr:HD domain-containing protein [Lachnospiraceae bacterium]
MIERILSDERYLEKINRLNEIEKDRTYCKHDLDHFQEVYQILSILSSRRGLDDSKKLSKTMAYFHDIGRADSYDGNHRKSSSDFARILLGEYGISGEEIDLICYAIDNHSGRIDVEDAYYYIDNNMVEDSLRDTWAKILRISDQLSRNCYICKANAICKWLEGEKTNENWKQRIC